MDAADRNRGLPGAIQPVNELQKNHCHFPDDPHGIVANPDDDHYGFGSAAALLPDEWISVFISERSIFRQYTGWYRRQKARAPYYWLPIHCQQK